MSLFVDLDGVSKVFPVSSSATGALAAAISSKGESERGIEGKLAVDGVTLTLKEGERLGIVGRNRAGKSTLLHLSPAYPNQLRGRLAATGKSRRS